MGDRVWFATTNWPGFPTASSGFSGFPDPSDSSSPATGDGTDYPVEVSLVKAVKWIWRVKRWRVTYTSPVHSASFDTAPAKQGGGSLTRERDIILPGYSIHSGGDVYEDEIGGLYGLEISFGLYADRLWVFDDPLYRIKVAADIGYFDESDPDPGNHISANWATTHSTSGTRLNASIDGETLPLFLFMATDQNPGTPTISIAPVEWWPYADTNGDPIWDATDGSQLRDPLS